MSDATRGDRPQRPSEAKTADGPAPGAHAPTQPEVSPGSTPGVVASSPAVLPVVSADRYGVTRTLGEGGMGTVLLCSDKVIGRRVAMKLIRGETTDASERLEARFLREARIQGQLEHPSIVPVYDVGRDAEGTAFFTMKKVAGATLREVLDGLRRDDPALRQQYPMRRILAIFGSVCQAIEFAHRRGVIHRDLKPTNVMLGDFGEVYVLDWGISRLLTDAAELRATEGEEKIPLANEASAPLTHADAVLGTPGYMSPEQQGGKPLGPRSDVYALGALLFEMLTLRPLSVATEPSQLLLDSAARGLGVHGAAPELHGICARATAPAAEARFESADELRRAVETFVDHWGSHELTEVASSKLSEIDASWETSDPGDPKAERAIYDAFGACRFAVQQALTSWPDNSSARACLAQATEVMVRYELRAEHLKAAEILFAELAAPSPALAAILAEARVAVQTKQAHIHQLERLKANLDPAVEARLRITVAVRAGLVWAVVVGALRVLSPVRPSLGEIALTAAASGVGLLLAATFGRRFIFQTTFNRRLFGLALATIGLELLLFAGLWVLTPEAQVPLVLCLFIWCSSLTVASVLLDWRLAPSALVSGVAFLLAASERLRVDIAAASVFVVVAVNIAFAWPRTDRRSQ